MTSRSNNPQMFHSGKYEGRMIDDIVQSDPLYITMLYGIPEFNISNEQVTKAIVRMDEMDADLYGADEVLGLQESEIAEFLDLIGGPLE